MNKKQEESIDNFNRHKCIQCCFRGFKEGTCSIEVVMPTKERTIYKPVKDYPTPNICPSSLNTTMTPLLPNSHYFSVKCVGYSFKKKKYVNFDFKEQDNGK